MLAPLSVYRETLWNAAVMGKVWQILLCRDDGKGMLQVSMDRRVLLFERLDSVHVCSCILPTQSPSHRALYGL